MNPIPSIQDPVVPATVRRLGVRFVFSPPMTIAVRYPIKNRPARRQKKPDGIPMVCCYEHDTLLLSQIQPK